MRSRQAILRQIALLWQTRPLRRERLYVADEVEIALTYLRDMFLPVLPALYARWERVLGHRPRSFLRLGSWIGGDRDGNPNVTAESLRLALGRASQSVLESYLDQLHALGAELSLSTELATTTDAVAQLAEHSGDANPGRADEPYRRAVIGIYARLAATLRKARRPSARATCIDSRASRIADGRRIARRSGRDRPFAARRRCRIARDRRRAGPTDPRGRDVRLPSCDTGSAPELRRACARRRRSAQGGGGRGGLPDNWTRTLAWPCCGASSRANACSRARSQHMRRRRAPNLRSCAPPREAHELYGPAAITTYIISKCESVSDMLEVNVLLKEAGLYRPQRSGAARPSWSCRCSRRSRISNTLREIMRAWLTLPEIRAGGATVAAIRKSWSATRTRTRTAAISRRCGA